MTTKEFINLAKAIKSTARKAYEEELSSVLYKGWEAIEVIAEQLEEAYRIYSD